MITSQAIVSNGKGHVSLEEVILREPNAGEVLVEIKATGICQTDLKRIDHFGSPIIPGHEGAGVITRVGEDVVGVQPGDHVLLNWAIPCGTCFQCDLGNEHLCEINSPVGSKAKEGFGTTQFNDQDIPRLFHLGTFARHAIVPEAAVTKVSPELPFADLAIVGCAVLTGYGSAVNSAKVTPGSSVAIIGCGGVGVNVIQGCRLSGARQIVVIDADEKRLEKAREFGATEVVLADRSEPDLSSAVEQVKALTDGRGADFSFECTGIPSLSVVPLALIRHGGTAVQISGTEQVMPVDMRLFEFDKTYINPLYGACSPARDIPKVLALHQEGNYALKEQVSRIWSFDEFETALIEVRKGGILKGVVVMGETI